MTVVQRLRILPLLVIVAGLSLVVRIGDFASGLRQTGTAFAQEEVQADVPPLPTPDKDVPAGDVPSPVAEDAAGGEMETGAKTASDVPEAEESAVKESVEWKDAGEAEYDYSEVREDLYKDLVKRRQELEAREKSMALREAMLEAAERELDQKMREMVAVRNDIQGLLQKQSDEEQARVDSLVRIYEGMKAKDAARIFNTLDMDVLISVIARMSERKSGPILAEMSPERARSVTILLAKQKQIPDIPPQ